MNETVTGYKFPDTGCSFHTSCLDCPLPYCRHDDPNQEVAAKTFERFEKIQTLQEQGLTTRQTADRVGCSERTVQRVMHDGLAEAFPILTPRYQDNRAVVDKLQRRSIFQAGGPPRLLAPGARAGVS